jgi:hypothetical protein
MAGIQWPGNGDRGVDQRTKTGSAADIVTWFRTDE